MTPERNRSFEGAAARQTLCGIAAYFAYGANAPPIDREALASVSAAMIRRGPDAMGEWISADRRLGLANRRLAIIDPSADGVQPMALTEGSSEPSLVVTFNGEIYNYRELRRKLAARGHVFRTNSDTEILLHLYNEHGLDTRYGTLRIKNWSWRAIRSASSRSITPMMVIPSASRRR